MLFAIVLFSCDENATCIEADDFGDLEREIIEVSSSDTFKCTVSTAYKDGNKYKDDLLSDITKVNPTLKECLTTNVHINANKIDAEEIRALFGEASSSSNLKGCQDYLTRSSETNALTAETNKNYTDYCETFCENLCSTESIGNDASPWIANTPRKENSDIGVNITPGSKISVTIQEGLISLPISTLNPIFYEFDPHNFSPNEVRPLPSISTGSQYDIVFSGDYFDNSGTTNSLAVPDGYAGCGASPTSYTRPQQPTVGNNRIKYDSLCGPYNPTTFAQDSLIFARRNIIYFEPSPNQNAQLSPVNADHNLWSCSENFPNDKAKIKCGKGTDPFVDDNKIGTSSKNIIKNGGFIRANDEVFVIKDEIIKNIPASSTTPIIFSTDDLGNSGVDVFVDLKTDCENHLFTLSIEHGGKIYYTANNLSIPRSYTSKNIPVYKGASLKATFTTQSTACTLTAKTQKYLDIPINTSGVAEFQMKDLSAISYNDIPNFNSADQSLLKDYFECSSANPFIQNFYLNVSNSKVVGMGANCIGSAPSNLTSNSPQQAGRQYFGLVPGTTPTPVNNSDGFTKIQIFRDDSGVKDIILFKKDDSAILASTGAAPASLYNCDSNPNCQELSCNGGRISGIKAQHDAISIKALSIICSENYVPVPATPPLNSCTLYGRILNPLESNLASIDTTTLTSSEVSKIISLSKIIASNPVTLIIPATSYVKKAYLGLQTYANSTQNSLTNPECKIPLDITSCSIGSPSCTINSSDVKKSWLYDCYNGDGLNGVKEASRAGTGGAGGGNNSKETRVKNGYTNDSAQAGKNGESYVNPEFGTIVVTDYAENADKGKGGVAGATSGSEGYLDLSYDASTWSSLQAISGNAETEITSVNGQKIYYRIKGGGGGAGGSYVGAASTTKGGNGANGDSFSGSFTLPALASGTWILKVKIGQGGGAGSDASSASLASNLDSPNYFKGGSGGAVDASGGGGGAGGSASYIAVVRSDETHDAISAAGATTYREDFLVIAGGGGGGGGATSQNAGTVAKSPVASATPDSLTQETRKISYDLRSNAKGYRLGFSFEPLATQTTPSDFYEYDNFFTKSEEVFPNSSGNRAPAKPLYSDDPLNKIVVTTTGSNKFFVRKGQVLRILPKSFEKLWNSKEGPKECGVGMILKVTPRPALLCLKGIEEIIPNPFCSPDYSSSITPASQLSENFQATSTALPAAPQTSGTQTGCAETTTCQENPIYFNTPTNTAASTPPKIVYDNITAFDGGQRNSYYCPNPNCSDVTCSGGSATSVNACNENTTTTCSISTPPEVYSSSNANPKMYSTASCGKCVARKIAEGQTPPQISVDANKNFNCYSFESYNKSANKFLSGYNAAASSSDKKIFIDSETAIVKVPPANTFGSDNNFGNIQNFKVMDNKTSFLMKQSVSTNLLGNFKGFVVHNDNFKNAITSVDHIFGTTKIQFTKKGLFSNGQQLAVALCKEDILGNCSALNLPTNKAIEFIPLLSPSATNTYFTFDSASGSIKRILASPVAPPIGGGKCDSELIDEKFICFKGVAGESADEIKKYRLSFKIIDTDDIAGNNSGSYKVRIEKREALKSRAGGIVNGVLRPITLTLEGALTDDTVLTPNYDDRIGLVQEFYVKLISNPLYKKLLTLSIVLALSFYGMGYLIGVNELKNSEIVKILLKIGFIYLFTSTETGIVYFNTLFVGFFKDAINYITFSVAENFDTANSNEIRIKIRDSSFYDKGILFKSVDKVIDLLMTGAVQKKILALLFSSIFGWIYFLIIYYCLMTYIYAIANSMLLYITCQIMVSILFVLGPIFFIFLMFKVTKDMFDNWLKALIGFSLQQIFLVMTLSLFNTFVYSFLKLALGYRICWTNVLSLNLIISKVSLFNFWTVAGTNSPESGVEDSPDSSFGSDENMPSLYLFLYLMIVVSLMKKFIQMFTDLAVSLAGGLKASTISAEAMSGMKSAVGAISQQVGKAYQASAGRVVANIDNTLFDSGRIAKSRKASEREQFASNMMTRASLHKAGNDAVSKYKKENGLKLSNMSSSEQKTLLEDVRMKGMQDYASENDISDKQLNSLLNKTGLDYNGSNLFGLAAQAAKQGVSSGGNLFTAVRDKKVETSFSKSEANSAIKKMKSPEQQQQFIENVKDGKVHVNKGKMEKARSFAISAVKEPVKAVLNPKTTALKIGGGVLSLGKSAIGMVTKSDPVKKEAVKRLKESGQIAKFNIPIINGAVPGFVKNWARTDEEKKIIRDKMREVSREKGGDNVVNKVTSKAVVRDLELTAKHAQRLETRGDLGKQLAHIGRFKERVQNVLSPNPSEQYKQDRNKDREARKNEREANPDRGMAERAGKWLGGQFDIVKGGKNLIENAKENLSKNKVLEKNETKVKIIDRLKIDNNDKKSDRNKETLKLKEDKEKAEKGLSAIDNKLKDEFGDKTRFGLLKEMKEELKNFEKNKRKFSDNFKDKIEKLQDFDLKEGLQKNIKVIEGSKKYKEKFGKLFGNLSRNRKENYVDGLIKKEISENPELKDLVDKRSEFRVQINEADAKIKNLGNEKTDENKTIYDNALKINEKNVKIVKKYEEKDLGTRAGNATVSKLASATVVLSSAVVNRVKPPKPEKREEYKKALKGVEEFNNGETTKDFEKFVNKHKDKLPKDE